MIEMIIPTRENIKMFDVKFLIENEENIDWEKLSSIKERYFSVPEIKMFGSKIAWHVYIFNHKMDQVEIDIAEKYFSDNLHIYDLLSEQNLSESFIRKNASKLNWLKVLNHSQLSSDFIFDMSDHWNLKNEESIRDVILSNDYINVNLDEYQKLALYLKLKE
jgi:glutamyl/glutaminyl-tRNA synthetase